MRKVLMCLSFALSVGPLAAQDSSLADIRTELGQLNASIVQLRSEVSSGNTGGLTITGDTLQRIDIIEAALSKLTSKSMQELIAFRICFLCLIIKTSRQSPRNCTL